MSTGPAIGQKINPNTMTFPSYFTKALEKNKVYGPYEEFYLERIRNNYFVSSKNGNTEFVDDTSSWLRAFTFDQNSYSNPFETLMNIFPPSIVASQLNSGLGKFSDTYEGLSVSNSSDLNMVFTTTGKGINSQNYLNQGVDFFWGTQRRHLRDNGPELISSSLPPQGTCVTGTQFSYIGSLNSSLYRVNYPNPYFDNPQKLTSSSVLIQESSQSTTKLDNVQTPSIGGTNPSWLSFTLTNNFSKSLLQQGIPLPVTVYPESPIMATFSVVKTQRNTYTFRSKLYDSNIGFPWNDTVEIGDIFSPDFIYFNDFIYKNLLTQSTNNKNMLEIEPVLLEYCMFSLTGDNLSTNISNNLQSPNLTMTIISYSNQPADLTSYFEIGGFVLIIPMSGILINQTNPFPGNSTYDLAGPQFQGFPYTYPTLQIRKIQNIVNTGKVTYKQSSGGATLTTTSYEVTFEDKDYGGGSSEFTLANTSRITLQNVTYFYLGKDTVNKNFITRKFPITNNIGITSFGMCAAYMRQGTINRIGNETGSGGPFVGKTVDDYKYNFSKKYYEFEFVIESLSQGTMQALWGKNTDSIYIKNAGVSISGNVKNKPSSPPYIQGLECIQTGGSVPCFGLYNANWTNRITYPGLSGTMGGDGSYFSGPLAACIPAGSNKSSTGDPLPTPRCFSWLDTDTVWDNTLTWSCPGTGIGANTSLALCATAKDGFSGSAGEYLEDNAVENLYEFEYYGNNTLVPCLSAKYIKKSVDIPYQKLDEKLYACLNNSSEQDIFNTRVTAQSTRIMYDGTYYYINEFRENSDFFTPKFKRTFKVNDTFDYYNSSLGMGTPQNSYGGGDGVLSGNKSFVKVLSLQVVEVGCLFTVESRTLDIFDYKCKSLTDVQENPFSDNVMGSANLVTGQPQAGGNGWKSFFLYKQCSDLFSGSIEWDYQLPYTSVNGSNIVGRSVLANITDQGVSMVSLDGPLLSPQSSTYFCTPSEITLDYYKFDSSKIGANGAVEPDYDYDTSSGLYSAFYPGWIVLCSLIGNSATNTGLPFFRLYSTTYSGDSIRAGLLDTMVLTGTTLTNQNNEKLNIEVTVTGKPAGIPFYPSSPESSNQEPSFTAYGKVKRFSITDNFKPTLYDTFYSDNGFQIKILQEKPNSYSYDFSEAPSAPINPYDSTEIYSEGTIVNSPDKNRKYFRNTTPYSLPYLKLADVESNLIPYSVSWQTGTSTKWSYPVYKKPGIGLSLIKLGDTEVYRYSDPYFESPTNNSSYLDFYSSSETILENLSGFRNVSKTVYPQVDFLNYDPNFIYGEGVIALFITPLGEQLYRSLVNKNKGNPYSNTKFWERVILENQLISNKDNFFYGNIQDDNNFTDFIRKIRNLDDQNIPAMIKRHSNKTEICPSNCTLYNTEDTYQNTFLDSDYYSNIRQIFEKPVLLTNKDTGSVITLGNGPLTKSNFYNTGYLQIGNTKSNFLSQYLYFINLQDQEDKYGKENCTGNLFITKSTGTSIDTGVSKFTFSNSLLFNFLPCDLDSQDFIAYGISPGYNSGTSIVLSSLDFDSSETNNVFPPYGVSCNVLVSSKNGTCFKSVNGHFKYTYVTQNSSWTNSYGSSLASSVDNSITIGIEKAKNKDILDFSTLNSSGCCYGDVWFNYNSLTPSESIYNFGFLIPNVSGGVSPNSFITLSGVSPLQNTVQIVKNSSTSEGTSYNISNQNVLNEFKLTSQSSSYTPGIFQTQSSNAQIKLQVEFLNSSTPLQRNEAIFYSDVAIEDGEFLYLPSYDITSNIKAKVVSSFGQNFLGNLSYSLEKSSNILSLENQEISPVLFTELKNTLLLTDRSETTQEVFIGTSTKTVNNCQETFIINFQNDGSFSIKPNIFLRPITSRINKLVYNNENYNIFTQPLGAINTESTTILISDFLQNLVPKNVDINFSEFLEYNTIYGVSTSNKKIPGKSIIQTQFSEIRQNEFGEYLDKNNICSIYFENTSIGNPYLTATSNWNVKYQSSFDPKIPAYSFNNSNQPGTRFYGNFTDNTELNLTSDITVYLGGNLSYIFDQSDSSNTLPMVFAKDAFSNNF